MPRTIQKTQKEDLESDDGDDGSEMALPKRSGRRKIKIEYIEDKNRRHITFSKRKAGIMKKAYELSTLTGTQVLLLVVSETGLVYTFTTAKLQPIVTKPEGKNLIQACLNTPDAVPQESTSEPDANYPANEAADGASVTSQRSNITNSNLTVESRKSEPSPHVPAGYMAQQSPSAIRQQRAPINYNQSPYAPSSITTPTNAQGYPAYNLPPHSQYGAPMPFYPSQQHQQQQYVAQPNTAPAGYWPNGHPQADTKPRMDGYQPNIKKE